MTETPKENLMGWNPYYSEEEERELNARQQAEAMDRHAESMSLVALRRRARGAHVTPAMEQAIVDVSPAKGLTDARS